MIMQVFLLVLEHGTKHGTNVALKPPPLDGFQLAILRSLVIASNLCYYFVVLMKNDLKFEKPKFLVRETSHLRKKKNQSCEIWSIYIQTKTLFFMTTVKEDEKLRRPFYFIKIS